MMSDYEAIAARVRSDVEVGLHELELAHSQEVEEEKEAWVELNAHANTLANVLREARGALGGVRIMLNTVLKEYNDEPWAQRVRDVLAMEVEL